MTQHLIDASHLELALVARRAQRRGLSSSRTRWCVMSAGTHLVRRCSQRAMAGTPLRRPSLMQPMDRGNMLQVIERVRLLDGLPAVRRTFGTGLQQLRTECSSSVMLEAA